MLKHIYQLNICIPIVQQLACLKLVPGTNGSVYGVDQRSAACGFLQSLTQLNNVRQVGPAV